jgi:hypothetical protein
VELVGDRKPAVNDLPAFTRRLCDDAAVFPPGSAPLDEAVRAHIEHRDAPYGDMVGPLVLPAGALADALPLLDADRRLDVALTAANGPSELAAVLPADEGAPVDVRAAEVAVPAGTGVDEFFASLESVAGAAPDVAVCVEVPRDERRATIIAGCAAWGYRAKFRTGGTHASQYPGEAELAASINSAVQAGVAFKATAGLHRAVRNTDPATGFEQHGFLNLLLAADAALNGRDTIAVLADRDRDAVAAAVSGLERDRLAAARGAFVSFGTCSIAEPLDELVELGLIAPASLASRTETGE